MAMKSLLLAAVAVALVLATAVAARDAPSPAIVDQLLDTVAYRGAAAAAAVAAAVAVPRGRFACRRCDTALAVRATAAARLIEWAGD